MTDPFDELSLLPDNAAEVGLPWPGPPAVARRQVDLVDGNTLSALVWGDAPPVAVLAHGGAQNAHTWDTVALALGQPLVAVDLPGHGRSSWRADHDYRPAILADALEQAVEALAPSARLLVGMSMGGLTSIAFAARRPDLVPALLLVDITPGVNANKSKAITDFISGPERFASFDEILERTISHNPGRSESSLRRGVLHNAHELPDGQWAWRWDPTRRGSGATEGEEGVPAISVLWDDLAATKMPLTLVRGGISPVVDDDDVAELLRRRPDAEVIVVDGAGHSIQGDRPLELAAIIATRLAG
jgi:pimeloyl-ACP methyl ester carboxylesterase